MARAASRPSILIACVGSLLQGDDGFGVAVAERLETAALPPSVHVVEIGTSGTLLVQELLDGYDVLVVVDAMVRRGRPGTVYLEEVQVPHLRDYPPEALAQVRFDLHHIDPGRAFVLARAHGVLPDRVFLLGVEPLSLDVVSDRLSPPVAAALAPAVERLLRVLDALAAETSAGPVR